MLTVSVFDQNEIHKGTIIDLELKVEALEGKNDAKDVIVEETKEIAEVEKERTDITKKELRKKNLKAVGDWFKGAYDKILYLTGGVALGVGIGIGIDASR